MFSLKHIYITRERVAAVLVIAAIALTLLMSFCYVCDDLNARAEQSHAQEEPHHD